MEITPVSPPPCCRTGRPSRLCQSVGQLRSLRAAAQCNNWRNRLNCSTSVHIRHGFQLPHTQQPM
eukprot:8475506-Prorocentrum_lima.AAC.1